MRRVAYRAQQPCDRGPGAARACLLAVHRLEYHPEQRPGEQAAYRFVPNELGVRHICDVAPGAYRRDELLPDLLDADAPGNVVRYERNEADKYAVHHQARLVERVGILEQHE